MNATNITTVSRGLKEFMNRSTAIIAIETTILLLIGLFAIGGNLLVIVSIYRNPSLRTSTNYFVLSLSITNILYPITSLPLTLVWSVKSRFIFGQETCDYQGILTTGLTYISVVTIALMAVNRFVRVCKPQKYRVLFNKKTSLIMICAVYITVFASEIIALYSKEQNELASVKFLPHKLVCSLLFNRKQKISRIIGSVTIVVTLVIPFTIIVYCYYKVFKKIREHKRNVAPSSNPSGLGTSVQEIKVTWTLFAVLLGYCVTWIPVLFVSLLSNIFRSSSLPRQAHMIVTFTGASSCAINPVIYGMLNTAFRQEYRRIVCLKWKLTAANYSQPIALARLLCFISRSI
jgi:melatonin receptor type 1A